MIIYDEDGCEVKLTRSEPRIIGQSSAPESTAWALARPILTWAGYILAAALVCAALVRWMG